MPDILSKKASVKVKPSFEKNNGSAPKKDMDNQARLVIKNACCIFKVLSSV